MSDLLDRIARAADERDEISERIRARLIRCTLGVEGLDRIRTASGIRLAAAGPAASLCWIAANVKHLDWKWAVIEPRDAESFAIRMPGMPAGVTGTIPAEFVDAPIERAREIVHDGVAEILDCIDD